MTGNKYPFYTIQELIMYVVFNIPYYNLNTLTIHLTCQVCMSQYSIFIDHVGDLDYSNYCPLTLNFMCFMCSSQLSP